MSTFRKLSSRFSQAAMLTVLTVMGLGAVRETPTTRGVPPVIAAQAGNCGACVTCEIFKHAVPVRSSTGFVGLHESCESGGCSTHGGCDVTLAGSQRAAELFALVHGTTDAELRAALDRFGTAVTVNLKRHAVQLKGCGETVAVSIPLSSSQVASLRQQNGDS